MTAPIALIAMVEVKTKHIFILTVDNETLLNAFENPGLERNLQDFIWENEFNKTHAIKNSQGMYLKREAVQ